MSMDVDGTAGSGHHTPRGDSANMDSPGPPDGWMPSDHPLPNGSPPPCEPPPLLMLPSTPSPMIRPEETRYMHSYHGLARRGRSISPSMTPSVPEVTSRKRKRTDDPPYPHIMEGGGAFMTGSHPQSSRRTRPRLGARQDREFSPLLIMSPGPDQDAPMEGEEEETTTAFHYPPATDLSHAVRRSFHPGHPLEPGPSIIQGSPSPGVDDLEDHADRGHAESAGSFAEVAQASTAPPKKRRRLSTLQGLGLRRPFEDTESPSPALGALIVHERGREPGTLFLPARSGRQAGDPWVSRAPADVPGPSRSGMSSPEPRVTQYFDRPMCDSPDSIGHVDELLRSYSEVPTIQVTYADLDPPESIPSPSHGRRQ